MCFILQPTHQTTASGLEDKAVPSSKNKVGLRYYRTSSKYFGNVIHTVEFLYAFLKRVCVAFCPMFQLPPHHGLCSLIYFTGVINLFLMNSYSWGQNWLHITCALYYSKQAGALKIKLSPGPNKTNNRPGDTIPHDAFQSQKSVKSGCVNCRYSKLSEHL